MRKNEKKILLLDMDDVIVEQSETWVQRLYEKTGVLHNREEWKEWNLHNVLAPETVELIFGEINKEPKFYYNLPAKKGAIEGIRELSQHYDIVFVSASEHYAYEDKYFWIESHLPFLPKPNLVLTHRKDLVMGDYLVDDGPHNLVNSPAKSKIIFDNPWNRHLTDYPRVTDWLQLVSMLTPRYSAG
jgi:5'-nucleotidase